VQREGSRLIKVQSVGLAAFGPLNPHTADASLAQSAFGEPPSADPQGVLCVRRWPEIGLRVSFRAEAGGGDPCAPQARIERIRVGGVAAAHAGWRTAEGIRPGMSVAAVHRIYPEAYRGRPGTIVLVEAAEAGGSGRPRVLSVTTAKGRVDALSFPIGASGG
jgi:hypothetical protein